MRADVVKTVRIRSIVRNVGSLSVSPLLINWTTRLMYPTRTRACARPITIGFFFMWLIIFPVDPKTNT